MTEKYEEHNELSWFIDGFLFDHLIILPPFEKIRYSQILSMVIIFWPKGTFKQFLFQNKYLNFNFMVLAFILYLHFGWMSYYFGKFSDNLSI